MCMTQEVAACEPGSPVEAGDALGGLVVRLQRGDDSALAPLIRATQGLAFRLARSMLRDDDQCQDVLQDAYIAVYRGIQGLRDVSAFRGWFARIVLNRCKRHMRRRPARSLDVMLEREQGPAVSGGESAIETREDLKRALAALSDQDRSVLMLREVVQMAYDEIATHLGIPIGTVRSRLAQARRRLCLSFHGTPPAQARRRVAQGEEAFVSTRAGGLMRLWMMLVGRLRVLRCAC